MNVNNGQQQAQQSMPPGMGQQPVPNQQQSHQQFMVQVKQQQQQGQMQQPQPQQHQVMHVNQMQMSHLQQQQQHQQQAGAMGMGQDPMSALKTMNPQGLLAPGPQEMLMRQQMPVQHSMAGGHPGSRGQRMPFPQNQPHMLPPPSANSPHSWTPAGGPSTPMSVSSPRPPGMVPSPAAPHYYSNVTLNTPRKLSLSSVTLLTLFTVYPSIYLVMGSGSHSSPAGAPSPQSEEQRRYAEKLQQLSKFIDPLRKMIERIERDDVGQNKNEVTKIKRLLDIISDPMSFGKGVTLDTLLKCEQVLEKMDFRHKSSAHGSGDQQQHNVQHHQIPTAVSSSNICQPLMDAIYANIKKPHLQSTLARTFAPAAAALGIIQTNATIPTFRSDIISDSIESQLVRQQEATDGQEIDSKNVLEGEIARLDSRFKVEEDVLSHPFSKSTQIIVNLDSLDLPNVPPLVVRIPECYPSQPPVYVSESHQYVRNEKSFFTRVDSLFKLNCQKLAPTHSLTSLLQTWEQSVRQACTASL